MMLVPDRAALLEQIEQTHHRLNLVMHRLLTRDKQRLDSAARQALFRKPELTLQPLRRRLADLAQQLRAALPRQAQHRRTKLAMLEPRLPAALPRLVQSHRQRIEAMKRQLQVLSPLHVLQRGYSYTLAPDGRVLRSVAQVQPAQRITTVLADGKVHSVVEPAPGNTTTPEAHGVTPWASASDVTPAPGTHPRTPSRRKPPTDTEPSLFSDPTV